ncbi:MAG TPA: polysaccharide biosynthesis C-terminal domain-containing protein [Edaphobacter sp.]|nr:polysaccharide biosynthesis C-terminal domain-containing protein [Edaphobacter sp.]
MLSGKILSKKPAGLAATLSKNVAFSLARLAINSLVALVLPAYLTHHLPIETYGAWVLILQLGAFVSYLDLGVQTGVAKFVAEYEAKGDEDKAGRYASAGLAIMTLTGLLGLGVSLILAWQVPTLFRKMPAVLYHDVRISVMLVGISLSFGLVCSIFSAVFMGLQRYAVPMGIAILNRTLFTVAILITVFFHTSLAIMGAAVALVNITTGLLQIGAWRKISSRIRISFALVDYGIVKRMARYCFLLAIWTVGMVCVSGLDTTIVGHYAYDETAFYSIAALPTTFLLSLISSILGPMMPASSALSTQRSPAEMGNVLARTTRYSTVLLLLTGLPLIVCGLPVLRVWVGPTYAAHSLTYLRILVLANIVRNLCAPYATLIAATGKQGAATTAAILEALVNLGSSIFLARRFGAIGVAFGTLLGSFVSVCLHFAVSMHFTQKTLMITRTKLFLRGIFRPAIVAIPAILLLPLWWSSSWTRSRTSMAILWGISTLFLAWFGSLNEQERSQLVRFARRRLMLSTSSIQ